MPLFYLLQTSVNLFCSYFSSADKQVKHYRVRTQCQTPENFIRPQELLMRVDVQWKSHYWLLSLLGPPEREGLHMLTPAPPITPEHSKSA